MYNRTLEEKYFLENKLLDQRYSSGFSSNFWWRGEVKTLLFED